MDLDGHTLTPCQHGLDLSFKITESASDSAVAEAVNVRRINHSPWHVSATQKQRLGFMDYMRQKVVMQLVRMTHQYQPMGALHPQP